MGTFEVGLNAFLHYDMATNLLKSGIVSGGLNENGPHRPIGNATSRKCGLVGAGMDLLEEVITGIRF